MDLYDAIAQRQSCRKYDMQPLPATFFPEMDAAIQGFDPLYPDVRLTHRIAPGIKGRFGVTAPHYLVITGQGKAGEAESAGFLYEQLVLWLSARDIGSVWLGGSKATDASGGDIITIGFGRSTESIHRNISGFKRKPMAEITNAPDNPCLEAVHLAPSGINLQPWYFDRQADGSLLLYRQKLKPPYSLIYKHVDLDMGIALCHYALAAKHLGKPFSFARSTQGAEKKGYTPFGIIS